MSETAKKRKPHVRSGVNREDFVRAWQEGETLEEVAGRLKMPKSNVSARAAYYRKNGVDLKTLARGKTNG